MSHRDDGVTASSEPADNVVMRTLDRACLPPMIPSGASTLRLPPDHAAVPFARFTLAALLARHGWGEDDVGRVLLAASEALSNAIEHGSPTGTRIEMGIAIDAERAEVTVRDRGTPGDVAELPPPGAPPDSSPRGRGLLIMHRLSDRLDVRTTPAGTDVTLGFDRRASRSPAERSATSARHHR